MAMMDIEMMAELIPIAAVPASQNGTGTEITLA